MNTILIFLLSLAGLMLVIAGLAFFWAVKHGQFEDLEGPAQRILMDDDDPKIPHDLKQKR